MAHHESARHLPAFHPRRPCRCSNAVVEHVHSNPSEAQRPAASLPCLPASQCNRCPSKPPKVRLEQRPNCRIKPTVNAPPPSIKIVGLLWATDASLWSSFVVCSCRVFPLSPALSLMGGAVPKRWRSVWCMLCAMHVSTGYAPGAYIRYIHRAQAQPLLQGTHCGGRVWGRVLVVTPVQEPIHLVHKNNPSLSPPWLLSRGQPRKK